MKVVLYYTQYKSFISKFVSFITNSPITHASVIVNGKNYDTDLIKDSFQEEKQLLRNEPDRFCIVYDFGNDLDEKAEEWIKNHIGTPYDLLGYFLWMFNYNPTNLHCFDSVSILLKDLGYDVPKTLLKRPTGSKLKSYLDSLNISFETVQCKDVLINYLK